MNQRKRALHEAEALKRKLAENTASAIAQKNIQFALDHQNDSLVKLKLYLRDCAAALGHTPVRTEIVGGDYIDLRFGSWKNALVASGRGTAQWTFPDRAGKDEALSNGAGSAGGKI